MAKPKVISNNKKSKPAVKKVVKKTVKKTIPAKKVAPAIVKVVKKTAPKTKKPLKEELVKITLKEKAQKTFLSREELGMSSKSTDTVVLPQNVSLRAKSKASVIASLIFSDFSQPAKKLAYTSGICFVLFGAVLSIANSILEYTNNSQAQLISTDESSTTTLANPNTTTAVVDEVPKIEGLPSIPAVLEADKEFILSASLVSKVEIFLEEEATLYKKNLPVTALLNDRYQFIIPAAGLRSGKYQVKARLTSLLGTNFSVERIGEFEVPDKTTPLESPVIEDGTSDNTAVATTSISKATTTKIETAPVTEIEEPLPTPVPLLPDPMVISVQTFSSEFTAPSTIQVVAPATAKKVLLFLRKNLSTTLVPLGPAIQSSSKWLYLFNPANTPNGTYEIIAKADIDGKIIVSEPKEITVAVPSTVALKTTPPPEVKVPPADEIVETAEVSSPETLPVRPLTTIADIQFDSSTTTARTREEVDAIFQANKDELNKLLQNYAAAQQSGDQLLISIATAKLQQMQRELVENLLRNPELNLIADDAADFITERITSTQRKIEIFEELRRNGSNLKTSLDTDGDGISDFDEEYLYNTDPKSPDTDRDGVTDGVEITKGFDPLDSSPEAIVRYSSPKQSLALVAPETLKINSVSPVLRFDISPDTPPVQAEVSGVGIPNSFVTLYIFSTPTVVTVKTDSDGSFVYTFENELEDGEHEVYVAITDNTGEIVAQSNPFRFVKEAQAFASQDEELITPVTSTIDTTLTENPYLSVIGLGVLALGLILLMLGINLKPTNREEEIIITEKIAA